MNTQPKFNSILTPIREFWRKNPTKGIELASGSNKSSENATLVFLQLWFFCPEMTLPHRSFQVKSMMKNQWMFTFFCFFGKFIKTEIKFEVKVNDLGSADYDNVFGRHASHYTLRQIDNTIWLRIHSSSSLQYALTRWPRWRSSWGSCRRSSPWSWLLNWWMS